MNDERIRIRINRSVGELEVEGPLQSVAEWWNKLWPELSESLQSPAVTALSARHQSVTPLDINEEFPHVFGEFYSKFRSDVTDVDKILIAGSFVQAKESDRSFSTKAANQLLLNQNIKVANASVNVRRLIQVKRVFVVSGGKFRISATGSEYLKSLRAVQ